MEEISKLKKVVEQKCTYNRPLLQRILKLGILVIGTLGLFFFNLWVAMAYFIYSIVWSLILMPLKHCQYCYFKIKESIIDVNTSKPIMKRISKEKWISSYLRKHVKCAKKWAVNFFILWVIPIVLIVISFFLNFSIYALLSLIGFIVILVTMLLHMRYRVCPACAIKDECFTAF